MAHGDRRWIRDWRGRLKKSKDRTRKDWLAELNAKHVQRRISSMECPQCKHLEKQRPITGYIRRYVVPLGSPRVPGSRCWECAVDRTTYDLRDGRLLRRVNPVPAHWHRDDIALEDAHRYDPRELTPIKFGWQRAECRRCREKDEIRWHRMPNGDRRRHWLEGVPAGFRRDLERGRRAEYKDLLRRAKFDAELYDEIPRKYHNTAAYHWW